MKAEFRLKNKMVIGEVVTINYHIVWVRLEDGKTIKRHKVKHGVMVNSIKMQYLNPQEKERCNLMRQTL